MHQPASFRKLHSPIEVARTSLEFGRLLLESGASARHVEDSVIQVATGLGADDVDIRVGYASLTILGLFAMTLQPPGTANEAVVSALSTTFRVVFTVGALGTGLAIPMVLLPGLCTKGGDS